MARDLFTKEEIFLIKKHYPTEGAKNLVNLLNRTNPSIRVKARKLGIEKVGPDLNEYINKFTPKSAYILGFIWADGFVGKEGSHNYSISFTILKKDFNEIWPSLNGKFNKRLARAKIGNFKEVWEARVVSKPLWRFLVDNDYKAKAKESPTKILSKIPQKLHKYFYRGWFDGDGSCCNILKKKF